MNTLPSPIATFMFTREEFDSPIVYVYYEEKVPLYVGYSKKGLHRPFHPWHDKRDAKERADHIQIIVFEDADEARYMAEELVYRYAPEYNIQAHAGFPQPPEVGAWVFCLTTMWYTTAEELLSGAHEKWAERRARHGQVS